MFCINNPVVVGLLYEKVLGRTDDLFESIFRAFLFKIEIPNIEKYAPQRKWYCVRLTCCREESGSNTQSYTIALFYLFIDLTSIS